MEEGRISSATVRDSAREETSAATAVTERAKASPWIEISVYFLLLSVVYWGAVQLVSGRFGFSLDDAYIHLQFARNLFETGEMAFNRGVPSSGCTAPAYPMLLAAFFFVVRNWYLASYLLGALCSLGTAWLVYAILRDWTNQPEIARWGGILTAVASPTVIQAYGGMEAPLYSLVFLLGLWLYGRGTRGARLAGASVFVLTVWLRPEFLLLLPMIGLERLIAAWRSDHNRFSGFLREILPMAAVWVVGLGLYAFYHWQQDGHLVPTTFHAKVLRTGLITLFGLPQWLEGLPAALSSGHWRNAAIAASILPMVNGVFTLVGLALLCLPLALGLPRAVAAQWRYRGPHAASSILALLMLIGYPLLRAMVSPNGFIWFQHQRYFAHLTPLLILVVLGALPMTGALRRSWQRRGLAFAAQRRRTLAWALVGTLLMGSLAVISVDNINDMQVDLAHWLRRHTEPGELIATNDIGAISFLTRRPILDTIGLAEPEILAHYSAGGTLEGYLKLRDPVFVVLFPNWYRDLSQREELLEPVHSVALENNVVSGGPELVVYRPRW